jgi:transposase
VAHVRVSTAFNRVLALEGAVVESVEFTDAGIVVGVARRARRHVCPCGWSTWARYDVARRRWRHLDLAAQLVWLEADIARIDCHACERVRTEEVPWARPGARCSRDVEDMIAWLAQRMDKSAIATLMRCAWRTVDATVRRLVGEHLDADVNTTRLEGLVRIGVDEISYKRGHAYLTVVADHDSGRVVWVSRGSGRLALEEFTTALGPARCARIEAITMDGSPAYRGVAEDFLPHARICYDPFHVIKWTNEALDRVLDSVRAGMTATLRATLHPELRPELARPRSGPESATATRPRQNGRLIPGPGHSPNPSPAEIQARNRIRNTAQRKQNGRSAWRRARFLLRAGAERLTSDQSDLLHRLRQEDLTLARAWELKEGLRDLYQHIEPDYVRGYLDAWCQAATTSAIPAFVQLARRVRRHFDGIANAVELHLSNSRLEGINSKIRVIQRRGYGHRNPATLAAMIHLCLGGITPKLPTRT